MKYGVELYQYLQYNNGKLVLIALWNWRWSWSLVMIKASYVIRQEIYLNGNIHVNYSPLVHGQYLTAARTMPRSRSRNARFWWLLLEFMNFYEYSIESCLAELRHFYANNSKCFVCLHCIRKLRLSNLTKA